MSSLRAATGRLRGRTRLIILVAAVLVVVGAVVAIAGGGGSDANAKFLAQANSICRSEEPAINSSGDPVQVAQLASQLLGNLQALGTPPRNAALWQQWLGAEEQAVQLLASGQTQEALAQARALSPLARQLGISACA